KNEFRFHPGYRPAGRGPVAKAGRIGVQTYWAAAPAAGRVQRRFRPCHSLSRCTLHRHGPRPPLNFPWTSSPMSVSFRPMAQSEKKHPSPGSLLIDAVLVAGFFLFIYTLVAPHVPTTDKTMTLVWGAAGAACMSG